MYFCGDCGSRRVEWVYNGEAGALSCVDCMSYWVLSFNLKIHYWSS